MPHVIVDYSANLKDFEPRTIIIENQHCTGGNWLLRSS
jgi:hypothetical protein